MKTPAMKFLLAAAVLTFSGVGTANASLLNISGTPVTVTSSINGGPSQSITVTADPDDAPGASIEIPGSTFSWMSAGDSIDFWVDQSNPARNRIDVNFAASDQFLISDYISLTFELAPNWVITNLALTHAISATVDTGISYSGNKITFDIEGLGQINPQSGNIQLLYFVAPEPGTIGLALAGAAALFFRRRR